MSHLARQEMYRDQTFGLDDMLAAIEKVTADDVLRLADRFFANGSLAVTVLGHVNGLRVTKEQLAL
jgi:predicted Zn-dependent peptidase